MSNSKVEYKALRNQIMAQNGAKDKETVIYYIQHYMSAIKGTRTMAIIALCLALPFMIFPFLGIPCLGVSAYFYFGVYKKNMNKFNGYIEMAKSDPELADS